MTDEPVYVIDGVTDEHFSDNWFSDEQCQLLAETVQQAGGNGIIVEIGCWEGKSTVALANAVYPEIVHAVDTWEGSPGEITEQLAKERDVFAKFQQNIAALTQGNVVAHRQDWRDWAAKNTERIKVCHIDAAHTYDEVRDNLEAVWPMMDPGSILCGDDATDPEVKRAVCGAFGRSAFALYNMWWLVKGFQGDIDADYPNLLPADPRPSRDVIREVWQDYTSSVSPWDMAMSLETCSYVWWLCQTRKPKKIIDWGSGLSSYVLRKYAAENEGVEVWSVDDNTDWLQATRDFLHKYNLDTDRVVHWPSTLPDGFDLVVYDLGGGEVRNAHYGDALDALAPGGVAILDDAHFPKHIAAMHAACEERGLDLYSVRDYTLDAIGRFAALAVKPDIRLRYEAACDTPSDIYEHLPHLRALAMESDNVIELGTRGGVSTIAFLAGIEASGGHVYSVDIDPAPTLEHDQWTFIHGDDCSPDVVAQLPNNVDVVFIDTSHRYDHTLAELNIYRYKVKPGGVIVLHDTELMHPLDAPRTPKYPVKTAIEQFCAEEGLVWKNDPRCYGLGEIRIPE